MHHTRVKLAKNAGLILLLILAFVGICSGQEAPKTESQAAPAEKPAKKPDFELSVKTKPILNLSLKSDKVRLVEVAAELSKQLKIPVVVGPTLQKEGVSIVFSELTLEPALQVMAPAVYIDYQIDTGSTLPPKPLGVFLYDANSPEPPLTAVVQGSTQSLLVEGDTEEGVEPQTEEDKKRLEEQPLRIQFQNNLLSVKAQKQPLALVLLKIGEELSIPVDIEYDSKDVLDMEFVKLPIEDAIRKLSPNIQLYLRADLSHSERRALRIVLIDPAKTSMNGS